MQGFLAAGHVCTVMGYEEYVPIAARYHVPIVVTGFEPLDILQGIYMCVKQLEEGRAEVENQYSRAVAAEGQPARRSGSCAEVFEVVARKWRGIGEIARSGLGLRPEYRAFDAEQRFALVRRGAAAESAECLSGLVLQGLMQPARVPGVRHALHARAPARRDDGVVGRRLRGVLPAPATGVGHGASRVVRGIGGQDGRGTARRSTSRRGSQP